MSTHDKANRPYAKLSELEVGTVIEIDGSFTCRHSGQANVHRDEKGLFFKCE